jgi:hypothetical protein
MILPELLNLTAILVKLDMRRFAFIHIDDMDGAGHTRIKRMDRAQHLHRLGRVGDGRADLSLGLELSQPVAEKLPEVLQRARALLVEWGLLTLV